MNKIFNRHLTRFLGISLILAGIFITSCNDFSALSQSSTGKYRVQLVFDNSGSRTLAPVLTPVSYHVQVSGGPTEVADFTSTTATVELELELGTYTFQVQGRDAEFNRICSGMVQATISSNLLAVPLTLTPLIPDGGAGRLDLEVRVPASSMADRLTLSIVPHGSPANPVDIPMAYWKATESGNYSAGSYDLSLSVYRGGVRIGGRQESLIFISNLTTVARINLDAKDVDLIKRVTGGSSNSYLIKADGTLWACGKSYYLGIPDATPDQGGMFTQVGTQNTWTMVTAGKYVIFGLQSDGSLWGWGDNYEGNLGDGTTTSRDQPTQIGSDKDWVMVDTSPSSMVSSGHTIALKSDGTMWTWGSNNYGQLGDGTTTPSLVPKQIGTGTYWCEVTAGNVFCRARDINGSLHVWGTGTVLTPETIPGSYRWKSISSRAAIRTDGSLWRMDDWSDLASVELLDPATDWLAIDTGQNFCLALKTDGSLWSWGSNGWGQLGDGTFTDHSTPMQIGTSRAWIGLGTGDSHSLAISSDGRLWSWGFNGAEQLGDGGASNRILTPQRAPGSTWSHIAGSLGMKSDGTLWAIGDAEKGQISTATDWKTFTVSGWLFIKNNGTLWERRLYTVSPFVQIGTDSDWSSMTEANANRAALKNNGELWCWGANQFGELGNGTIVSSATPTRIGTDTDWILLASGNRHTLAIKADGSLWSWGSNDFGELGDGTAGRLTPGRIGTDNDWASIATGDFFSIALKKDGSLWAWGVTLGYTPQKIGSDTDWQSIVAGRFHCFSIKTDGSLWAWGINDGGQLGNGTRVEHRWNSFIRVGDSNNWLEVACGDNYSRGIQKDGSLWAWGNNANGQLGLGINTASMGMRDVSIY